MLAALPSRCMGEPFSRLEAPLRHGRPVVGAWVDCTGSGTAAGPGGMDCGVAAGAGSFDGQPRSVMCLVAVPGGSVHDWLCP